MSQHKPRSRFAPYHRSIWLASWFGLGLLTGYMDGFNTKALVESALIFASIMALYFSVLALWQYIARKRSKRNPS